MPAICPRAPLRHLVWLLAATIYLTASVPGRAQSSAPADLASFPRAQLAIVHREPGHGTRTSRFEVWVADTPERAAQGLMFVSDLPESRGMVFPLSPPRVERMWMKNTYIELDMLFVDSAGRIRKILRHARPLSLDTLSSDTPVSAVVELRGGEAEKLSLAVGDLVTWKAAAAD